MQDAVFGIRYVMTQLLFQDSWVLWIIQLHCFIVGFFHCNLLLYSSESRKQKSELSEVPELYFAHVLTLAEVSTFCTGN